MTGPRAQTPERSDGPEEVGGESACQLARVCEDCGALPDGPPSAACERCGTTRDP